MDIVNNLLSKWRKTPFVYGDTDCLNSIAAYVHELTGIDHATDFRGTYADETGARRRVEESGGVLAIIDRSGFPRVEKPERGDIVVMKNEILYPGICTGDSAAFRMPIGVLEIRLRFFEIVAVWSVPKCAV